MRLPIIWLKDYLDIKNVDVEEISSRLSLAGFMLDKKLDEKSDIVLDLELRGNRAEMYSILGITREVSVLFNLNFKPPETDIDFLNKIKTDKKILTIEASELVNRFYALRLNNIKIGPSPDYIKKRLDLMGVPSINNVVDITNFVMFEYGQPLHAFDGNKLDGPALIVRRAKKNENFVSLDDVSVSLSENDLVIADKNKARAFAGIVGGKTCSIDSQTNEIILEAANYNRVNIRRSSQNHNIRTEASTRLEKFLDPNLVDKTLARCLELLQKYAGAKIISRCDYYPNKTVPKTINFNYNEVKRLTGVEIPQDRGIDILRRLDFQVVKEKNNLKVTVPTIRADIEGEADLVEEIVRIYGYDKLPSLLIFEAPPPKIVLPNFLIANICRRILTACGFNEAINLPIINDGKLSAFGAVKEEIVFLVNPPGHDFNALRTSLIPGLSDNINISRQNKLPQNAFFEIGRVFKKDGKDYGEEEVVAGAIYNSNFRFVKGVLELLCKNLGINEIADNRIIEAITVKNNILFFELPVKELINAKKTIYGYKTIPLYPPIIEDLTFLFNGNIYCSDIIKEILSVNKNIIAEAAWKADYNENSLVARTFTVIYQSPDKTLSNEEIAPIRKEIVTTLEKKFGARLKGKV